MLAPRYTCSCYHHEWWCCSQPCGGGLPLAGHRPVTRRQLLPLSLCKMKGIRQTRGELGKNGFCLLTPFLIRLCSFGNRSFFSEDVCLVSFSWRPKFSYFILPIYVGRIKVVQYIVQFEHTCSPSSPFCMLNAASQGRQGGW